MEVGRTHQLVHRSLPIPGALGTEAPRSQRVTGRGLPSWRGQEDLEIQGYLINDMFKVIDEEIMEEF